MTELEEILDNYIRERNGRIDTFLSKHLGNDECIRIQKSFFLQDIIKNPINVLWAIPYFSLKKVLETAEKLGIQSAARLLQMIPKSLKTDYQKEIERLVLEELFQLSETEVRFSNHYSPELTKLLIMEIRKEISLYCMKQNEVTDLVASSFIVLFSQYSFGDKTLDLFGLGNKFAQKWTHKKAAKEFFLGESLGNTFYTFAPVNPSEKQIFLFTAAVLLVFGIITTAIGVMSFPVQKRFGVTRHQLQSLTNQIHDRLLLTVVKAGRPKKKLVA